MSSTYSLESDIVKDFGLELGIFVGCSLVVSILIL